MINREIVDELAAVAVDKHYNAIEYDGVVELFKLDGATIFVPYDIGSAATDAYFEYPGIIETSHGIYTERTISRKAEAQAVIEAIKKASRERAQIRYGDKLDDEEAKRRQLAKVLTSWEVFV